ncbi:hypothetical protein NQ317_015193 [Molorchus minor]|uniref:Uncharacterized protein n=1 Tax=Molorchus minor TaxID=1323400 RepID=A0ABQ9JN01_9CUCU|nr:hypothetical protein NQ317_015193 [Molorchus minor]
MTFLDMDDPWCYQWRGNRAVAYYVKEGHLDVPYKSKSVETCDKCIAADLNIEYESERAKLIMEYEKTPSGTS